MMWGFRSTQAIYVVSKLGVPDLLKKDGSMKAEEIAQKLGVNPKSLYRVMRALASAGVFTQDIDDRFGLTPISDLLRSDVVDSMRPFAVLLGEEHYRGMGDLLYAVKTGQTSFDHIYGMGLFEYLSCHPEANATFNAAMHGSGTEWTDLPKFYEFDSHETIVDIGGGKGALITAILKANPQMHGVLYDLPHVLTESEAFLKTEGVLKRCKIIGGNALVSVPSGGDLYVISAVLHAFQDDKALKILDNCRSSIPPNGKLLIIEHVLPEGDVPYEGKMFDLLMLSVSGGMERTRREWKDLLSKSRFELRRVIETTLGVSLIEAEPA